MRLKIAKNSNTIAYFPFYSSIHTFPCPTLSKNLLLFRIQLANSSASTTLSNSPTVPFLLVLVIDHTFEKLFIRGLSWMFPFVRIGISTWIMVLVNYKYMCVSEIWMSQDILSNITIPIFLKLLPPPIILFNRGRSIHHNQLLLHIESSSYVL